MGATAAYWYLWIHLLPRIRGYKIVEETVIEDNGGSYNKLTKVWNDGHVTGRE